jgi:hypothetical protein
MFCVRNKCNKNYYFWISLSYFIVKVSILFGKWKYFSCSFTQTYPCRLVIKPTYSGPISSSECWNWWFKWLNSIEHTRVFVSSRTEGKYFAAKSFLINNTVKDGRIFRAHTHNLVSYSCSYAGLSHIFLPPRLTTTLSYFLPNFRVRVFPLSPAKTLSVVVPFKPHKLGTSSCTWKAHHSASNKYNQLPSVSDIITLFCSW